MKALKFFIPLICLLSCGSVLHGQSVNVRVVSEEEALAYAYVYVNGEAVGVTDSMGIFVVPQVKLNSGDTVSASFVGFEKGSVVYDSNAGAELVIDLKPDYRLDPVTVSVKGIDMLRFLKKHVNFPEYIDTGHREFDLSFECDVRNGEREDHSNGDIKLAFPPLTDRDRRYKCLSFEAAGDTTGVRNLMGQSMAEVVRRTQFLAILNVYKGAKITSRGIVGDERIFILSYTMPGIAYQVILYVDKDNKNIRHFEISALSDTLDIINAAVYLNPPREIKGKDKESLLSGYEWEFSSSAYNVWNKIKVDKIKESFRRSGTFDLFYDGHMDNPI